MHTPITIDNATGQILEAARPQNGPAPVFGTDQSGNTGFGPTRKMLDTQIIHGAPWLTPELAEREMQMGGFK